MEQAFEKRPWLLPLSLAILVILFLRPLIIPPGPGFALDGKDLQSMFYPLQEYISQTLHGGELPLWNPHQFIGHPIIGNPHSALFYPATWFMWLVGVVRGMNLSIVFHIWLGAWGMAVYLRRFEASRIGSLLAGVIYAMSGWVAARLYIGHYNLLVVFGWIPWLMAAYHYALSTMRWRSTLFGMAGLGMALLAGHPPLMVYGGLTLVTLWVNHVARSENMLRGAWDAGRQLVLIVAGGLILGAALVIPAAELTGVSARSSTDIAFANASALPPAQFLDVVLPGLFGNPKVPPYYYWGADFFEEFTAYAGLLPLLAIPLMFHWRNDSKWYFMGLIALGAAVSVGLDGTLMPFLWEWVPGATTFRVPARGLYFIVIAMAGLTALLITALQNSDTTRRAQALRPAVRLWLPVAVAVCFIGAIFFSGWYASASHVEPMPLRAFIVGGVLAEAGVILLGVWFVLWLWSSPEPKALRWALPLTCLLVILDAWHVGYPIIGISQLHEDPMWAGARINVPLGADARVLAPLGYENLASVTGHLNIAGYDPLPVDAYRLLDALNTTGDPDTPVRTLLGVKYLMATKPYDKPNFQLIGIAPGGIYYRRTDAFPRTWVAQEALVEPDDEVRQEIVDGKENMLTTVYLDHFLECPASSTASATITDYRADSVEIKTSGGSGILVLSDQYYPGWQATIDGQPTQIVRADTVFRAVCLPEGDHLVRFEYRPLSLYFGMALSAIGWLALLIAAIFFRFKQNPTVSRPPDAEPVA